MTPHNNAKKEDIAKTVLMPGDPMRAKYIAETFLEDCRLVNDVRGMTAYTGKYKDKEITIFPHGMGMPSAGIYIYELFKFYDVENIIRIGSCGANEPELELLDTLLVNKSYTPGNFAFEQSGVESHIADSSEKLNTIIKETAIETKTKIKEVNAACLEVFDWYADDIEKLKNTYPKELSIPAGEMESFAVFYLAKKFNRNASCLLTVVDSHFRKDQISAEDREKSLNQMIKLALEASVKI